MLKLIIPSKGTSQRVENKNLREFGGSSLLEICLDKVKDLNVDEVIVNSEDQRILDLAKQKGVTAQKRPDNLATPKTKPNELAHYLAQENPCDTIFYVHCTNPFIKKESFEKALAVDNWKDFDSINSAFLLQKHLWHKRTPLYDIKDRPSTQQIKDIFCLEYSFNLIKRDKMLEYSDFIGKNPAFVILEDDEVFDIDTEKDFLIAQELWKKN